MRLKTQSNGLWRNQPGMGGTVLWEEDTVMISRGNAEVTKRKRAGNRAQSKDKEVCFIEGQSYPLATTL